ncbi:type 1 glutamine amidotransferase [Catellatospora tritici]|uniref:type 1 glutamine amidotransferase n=1 Tax=Catellatospora tritici TaxID=2851566 RepID=UPI001C2D2BA0|nr:type 1 glutamine amidotransferase [Catellatospora tritici]MBV1854922.1 type 1 glutamine amidotransferase [Catellatospora tritici]
MATALVIENDPTDDLRRLGDWLTEAGLELAVLQPHKGDELPDDLAGYAAFVVLGRDRDTFPTGGVPGAPWLPKLEGLLRKAVKHRVPTLGICLGGQLLAQAHGGTVERSTMGPEIGARLVARRDVAESDPLWWAVPFAPDVIQYHFGEITELPIGATLLAASPRYPHQAFRLGDRAWGTQFHIECDLDMFAAWVEDSRDWMTEQGWQPDGLVAGVEATQDDMAEVWQPFARRFADLALGRTPEVDVRRDLPLLG